MSGFSGGWTVQQGDGFGKGSKPETLKSDALVGADLDRAIARHLKAGETPTHVRALYGVGYRRIINIQQKIGLSNTYDRRRRKKTAKQAQLWD